MKSLRFFKNLLLSILIIFTVSLNIQAQGRKISGKVIDQNGSMSLPGVNVAIKGTTIGTITNFDGEFSIEVGDGPQFLTFSFIGYLPQEIDVTSISNVNVSLIEDVEQLEEVVVVGYGVQKKSVVTGAIAGVKADEITETPVSSAAQALQGRTPGVMVNSVSGQPGAGVDIRVRGTGSNGSNSPLFVVDGMQMDNIDFLNPNDIASMEVLKDAASSAIYGSRGANGVIMITTKKGKSGESTITYDGYYGIQHASNTSDVLNASQYMSLHNQGAVNAGRSPIYSESDIANPSVDTNWQNEMFETAPIQSHSISSSGGSENSTYLASMSYFGQEGIVAPEKSQFDRYTFRLNSTHKISNTLNAGVNVTYVREEKSGIHEQDQFGSVLQNGLLHDPLTPVYETDPQKIEVYDGMSPSPVKGSNGQYYGISDQALREIVNPLAQIETTNEENLSNKFIGNVFLEYKPMNVEGLRFKTDFGIESGSWANRNYSPEAYYNPVNMVTTSSVNQSQGQYDTWQWENIVTYDKTFNDVHKFSALGGMTMRQSSGTDVYGSASNMQLPGWEYGYVGNGSEADQKSDGGMYDHRLLSYFGRVGYDYDEKYLFSATIRYDGSSNFGPNYQYGFFPSLQAGWVVTNEDFLKYNETINFLKLRASWGKVGNENIPPFGYMSTFGQTASYPLGYDGVPVPGYGLTRMENPDLKWEAAQEFNFGVDAGFFDDALLATMDVYSRERQDLLGTKPVPGYTGLDNPITNLGTVQNKGVELALTYQNNKNPFKYSVTANASYNDNTVTEVNNTDGKIYGGGLHGMSGNMMMEEGHSLPYFYGYKTDGVFQTEAEAQQYNEMYGMNAVAGDIRYTDTNGDGVIDENDRTDIGSPVHDWTYGLTIKFDYKGFDFSMFWQGQAGAERINATTRVDLIESQNYTTRYMDSWTPENGSNTMPRFTHDDTNNNYSWMNDMVHIENASYIRLQNVQVGYTLPQSVSKKAGMSRCRIYLSGNNLYTFTNYSGMDPAAGNTNDVMNSGFDMGSYPTAASYLIGLNVTF
ncbi:SusC/RagA family TonB-linked outer membrane protein [Flammeovirga kamogawensis]|uniref:TonB-dependent receptor n=1 Tax=Flammeovirga kamogawensis TaxID=373891 RepID=A0ABX8H3F6_9BACT|nr:TonB-dependent receptor [Flammeovirga kamogawensis]MBB6462571.1 TonB-linked SusC/RagA family outer membrane protein [Flammeovirga kamogawensis]QWG09680.1 TonB-dependent receptor [Flammeovirga kamogawensis]TRX65193.1 TonB-dependent receptor [Flammeovirga kamogawensis]